MSRTKADPRRRFQFVLDPESGVPIYRQIINQVMGGIATGALTGGDQLPTVRQLSVDLAVNPNTIVRAYRELEIRGVLETQQGTGTFITPQEAGPNATERRRQLRQLVSEFVTRANGSGFTVKELLDEFGAIHAGSEDRRR